MHEEYFGLWLKIWQASFTLFYFVFAWKLWKDIELFLMKYGYDRGLELNFFVMILQEHCTILVIEILW